MAYTPTVWKNGEFPPIDAEHLNKIEQGIADAVSVTAQSLSDAQKAQARGNINAAPGGYGLGQETLNEAENNDANTITKTGWYMASVNTPVPGWWIIYAITYGNTIYQFAYANEGASGVLMGSVLQRSKKSVDVDWTPWEWVNPPMTLGVEYRTTERYLGKPVYTQVINCGSMPDIGSSKDVSIAAFNVAVVTFISGWCSYYAAMFDETLLGMTMTANNSNIVIKNLKREVNSNAVMYALVKYTKTTD